MMIWQSRYFTYAELIESEVAIRHGIKNIPNAATAKNLSHTAVCMDEVREMLGHPCIASSGYRGPEVNRIVGGSDDSDHTKGFAVDFKCPKFGPPKAVCQAIAQSGIKFDQLIFEGTWVHLSFNPRMRQQILTAVFKPGNKTTYRRGIV